MTKIGGVRTLNVYLLFIYMSVEYYEINYRRLGNGPPFLFNIIYIYTCVFCGGCKYSLIY